MKKVFSKDKIFLFEKFATLEIINSLWNVLSKKRKVQFFLLLFLMTFSGLLEITLIRYLLPLINNFANPSSIDNNLIILSSFQNQISKFFDLDLKFLNTIIYSILVIVSTNFKLATLWTNERYTAAIGNDISYKAFSTAIRLPYSLHISKNSSDLIAAIFKYCDDTTQFVKCLLNCIYFFLIALSISFGLFLVNFKISLLAIIILFFIYSFLSNFTKNKLILDGKKITSHYAKQTQIIQEGLGSIRDLIINRSYDFYEESFLKSDVSKRKAYADSAFISSFPKALLEGLGIIIVLLLLNILNILNPNADGQNLGVIGAFALGCQKLLPAIQTIYTMISRFRTYRESVSKVIDILPNKNKNPLESATKIQNKEKLVFENIKLDKVFFKYEDSNIWNINSFNLIINSGEKIGIIGSTGCGKSTLIDLIIGLLKPQKGNVFFNGINIHSKNGQINLAKLHAITSYIPQNIFITNDTIYQNIAFGLKNEYIDKRKVIDCAKKAKIHDLIISKPNGYKSFLGERGVNLSGGQIQRIGIARALYKNPKFLILDEATSALDNKTEKKVLSTINNLASDITLIMIAHRLNTLSSCDKVLELENGNLKKILSNEEINKRISYENF